jgi:hypothetical protein
LIPWLSRFDEVPSRGITERRKEIEWRFTQGLGIVGGIVERVRDRPFDRDVFVWFVIVVGGLIAD